MVVFLTLLEELEFIDTRQTIIAFKNFVKWDVNFLKLMKSNNVAVCYKKLWVCFKKRMLEFNVLEIGYTSNRYNIADKGISSEMRNRMMESDCKTSSGISFHVCHSVINSETHNKDNVGLFY